MHLLKGTSQKIMWANVRSMVKEGYKRDKAIAIARRKAGLKNGKKKK